MMNNQELKILIEQSQHCQRNWDLSKVISSEDLDLLTYAVKTCPSKQNYAFYKCYFVLNRSLIESIFSHTTGFGLDENTMTTNSQTLANLLIIFCPVTTSYFHQLQNLRYENNSQIIVDRDVNMAIGVAGGYINLLGHLMGFKTGFCACFDPNKIQKLLNSETPPSLILGIGYSNLDKNRLIHQITDQVFPSKIKENIVVEII